MLMTSDINEIFDIDEEVQEIDMDLDDDNVDDMLDSMLDATDGVGHIWEVVDDDKLTPEGSLMTERVKTFTLPVGEYVIWIQSLEKAGLNYVRHDRQSKWCSNKRK